MSQENVEAVEGFLEAFNREDYAACLDMIDPDVAWHPPPDIPDAAVVHGRDALIENFQDWLGAWDDYRRIPEEVLEGAGNTVLVDARLSPDEARTATSTSSRAESPRSTRCATEGLFGSGPI